MYRIDINVGFANQFYPITTHILPVRLKVSELSYPPTISSRHFGQLYFVPKCMGSFNVGYILHNIHSGCHLQVVESFRSVDLSQHLQSKHTLRWISVL